jgi:hypothetical protein
MNHFQRVASGHFAIRKLERLHGQSVVRQLYQSYGQSYGSRPKIMR